MWVSHSTLEVSLQDENLIENNYADSSGGVFYISSIANLTINKTTFTSNTAADGNIMYSLATDANFTICYSHI